MLGLKTLQVSQPPIGAPAPRSPAPILETRPAHPTGRVFLLGLRGGTVPTENPAELHRISAQLAYHGAPELPGNRPRRQDSGADSLFDPGPRCSTGQPSAASTGSPPNGV